MDSQFRINSKETCRVYFESFLPALRGELLISGLRSLNCSLAVRVTDMEDTWVLVIQAGRLEAVLRDTVPAPCTFCLDTHTLIEVATGVLPPDRAFFDLRIEIEGDTALGLQLSTVLAPFFQQYPFRLPAA